MFRILSSNTSRPTRILLTEYFHIRWKLLLEKVLTPFLLFKHFYCRYERQSRGSAHVHCILWVEGASHMNISSDESRDCHF
ncbi:hypothetical protein V1514DRAFT_326392 [Lipomyces japonicus]|uniref:uncharacterized protein n=1 Tax=Lipomyces japonicus TaxID=56871 RepID=UPI0034CD0987